MTGGCDECLHHHRQDESESPETLSTGDDPDFLCVIRYYDGTFSY
jgi:hypothetical protein